MTGFIEWLEEMAKENSKIRAVLRRSLTSDPGTCIDAFPYVERFLKQDAGNWYREMHYLVAGLWASHWKEDRPPEKQPIEKACAAHMRSSKGSESFEKRFISTLDADPSQLAYRLRQLVSLLKEYPLDFSKLLNDLLRWKMEKKSVQIEWARCFYRALSNEDQNVT